ncbi:MAG TPA: MFS transporter, partial [Dehalococcoidia bacterium]|nr:MFS transporter [Dehalococcoidia bacterium]
MSAPRDLASMTTPALDNGFAARLALRLPFFYGWVIIAIGFLSSFMTGAVSFWGLPVFVKPMSEATGWSHAAILGGLSLRFMFGAIGGLTLGHFADRRKGPSMLLLGSVLLDASALISLRWVHSSAEFLIVYGLVGGLASTGSRIVPATLVAKWYITRRGRAVGFSTNGGGVSALIMVPVVALLINVFGWRDAWTALAIIELALLLPMVPLAIRQPEDVGLLPDDGYVPEARARPSRIATGRDWSLREVV